MTKAFIRIGLITAVTAILGFFAVFGVRILGLQMGFSPPSHAWIKRPFWWIFRATAEDLCQTKDVDSLLPEKSWIVTLPVRRASAAASPDQDEWLIPCTVPRKLKDFLSETAHADWLVQVEAHDTWSLDQLVEKISAFDQSKNFGVLTESQKVAIYLRKKAPQWLYAADPSSLVRFRMFESLWVETVMDFWPDFVVATLQPHAAFRLDERGSRELLRRQKRLIWDWDDKDGTEPQVPFQGIMTKRPSAAQQKFGSHL